MPFNPGQFVYQPRPLQNWDFGQGFRDLIQARLGRRNSDLYKQSLDDFNTRYAADFAKDRGKTAYDKELDRYNKRMEIAEKMRAAGQGNQRAAFEALRPTFLELGGTIRPDGSSFILETGQRPELGGLDIQGTRQQIFGGQNVAAPQTGQPTMVPGFGPDGQRNPMDPSSVPGLSAATFAAPYNTSAGTQPPPSAGPQAPQQPTGPNPTAPQAFNPYRINFEENAERNRRELRPFYDAATKAAPVGAQGLVRNVGEAALSTGLPPEQARQATKDTFNELAGIYRGGVQADATRAQLGLRQQGIEFNQAQRLRDRADQRGDAISRQHSLPKLIQSSRDADVALEEIAKAEAGNPDAVNAAIVSIVKSKQDRVSDADFRNASVGARNIWEAMKRGVAETLFTTGFTTDHARDLREVVGIIKASNEKAFRVAQQQLLLPLASNRLTPEEREWYIVAAAKNIPFPEYWDPVVKDYMGIGDTGSPQAPQAPEASDNLGVVPLPRVEQRASVAPSPRVSPNGVPLVRSERVPEKPPAKPKGKYDLPGVDKKTQGVLEEADAALEGL